jgi:hypothetical protein
MSEVDLLELARKVRRLDDRQQLAELISRYGMAVDDRDFNTIPGLFAPAGVYTGVPGPPAVVDFYRERLRAYTATTHYAHSWHFDFDSDDRARGAVNAHAELCIDGKAFRLSFRYLDRYVRSAEGWVFQEREIRFRYVLPFDEVADGLADPLRVRWPGVLPRAADLPDSLQTYIDSRR